MEPTTEVERRPRPRRWWAGAAATSLLLTVLAFSPPASAETSNVSYGQTINAAISSPGEKDTYRFTGATNDRLSIDAQSCCSLKMKLIDPIGNVIWNDVPFTDSFVSLPRNGTYQLIMSYGTNPTTGTYKFAINNVKAPQSFATAYGTTISNGVPAAGMGNIELPGAADRYTFSGSRSDRLSIDAQSCCSLKMKLIDPIGNVIWNDVPFTDSFVSLPRNGTYQLIMSYGANPTTGTYKFAINNVRYSQLFSVSAPISVSNGVPRAGMGNIELPGSKDLYRFNARAGQQLSIDARSCCSLRMKLRGPDGRIIWNDIPFTDSVVTLPQDGQYDLWMSYGTNATTGTYAFDMDLIVK